MSGWGRSLVAGVVAAALMIAAGALLLRGPAVVEQVSVVNASEFDILIEVSSGVGGDGWTRLTTVDRRSSSRTRDVIDQGDVWVFRFRAQGRAGGVTSVTRADLRRAGWTLEVPPEVIERLRLSGAPATP